MVTVELLFFDLDLDDLIVDREAMIWYWLDWSSVDVDAVPTIDHQKMKIKNMASSHQNTFLSQIHV